MVKHHRKDQGELASQILKGVRSILGSSKEMIGLHEPEFSGHELEYVQDCIRTGWVSSVGKYVDLFEQKLAEYTGAKHAIAVVNGTAALHIALILAGVNAGDEVILPALTFVATANSVMHCGGIPHFVDNDPQTLGLDIQKLDDYLHNIADCNEKGVFNRHTGRRIAAIVPMHTFGHPIDLDALMKLAESFQLPIVEDAAEALGSYYKGKHAGTFGELGILSFNGNKIITTGGGGAILTNNSQLAQRAKHITTTAKKPHPWLFYHDELAYNYRLPNINAALGCAQLEQLPQFLERKRQLAMRYRDVFSSIPGLEFIDEPLNTKSNFWLNTIRLELEDLNLRDLILQTLNDAGYQSRPAWVCLSDLPMYANTPRGDLSTAKHLEHTLISLPSGVRLQKPSN